MERDVPRVLVVIRFDSPAIRVYSTEMKVPTDEACCAIDQIP